MDSKLVRLIDYSLLPFSLTILGKTVGLYAVLSLLNVEWGLGDFPNSLVSVTPIVYGKDLMTVATYSNLFMYSLLIAFFSLYLIVMKIRRNRMFSNSLIRVIVQSNFVNIFQKNEFLYTRIFVWFVYVWLVTIYILLDSVMGRTAAWLALVSFVLSTLVSFTIFTDMIKEYQGIVSTQRQRYL